MFGLSMSPSCSHFSDLIIGLQGLPIVETSRGSRQVQLLARSTDEYIHRFGGNPISLQDPVMCFRNKNYRLMPSPNAKVAAADQSSEVCALAAERSVRRMLLSHRTAWRLQQDRRGVTFTRQVHSAAPGWAVLMPTWFGRLACTQTLWSASL